ncbi:MAG: tail fiber domain-containing protein [Saprospiraceae bacterium]
MTQLLRLALLFTFFVPVLAKAQSGIGTFTPDSDKALHVVAQPGQQPVRLEGLNDDGTDLLTDVVVTDATGVLYYRPIEDLTVSGEWTDAGTYIYATRARNEGTARWISITDEGDMGFGTNAPRAGIDLRDRGMIIGNSAVSGLYNPSEEIRLTGGTSDVIMSVQDGTGRFNIKWNASFGTGEEFLSTGDYASKILVHGDPNIGGDVFRIDHSTAPGVAGNPVGWTTAFNVENNGQVGIGTSGPTEQLDVNGRVRIRTLDNGVITGDPLFDDDIVTVDGGGVLRRVDAAVLFDDVGEWVDNGNYIYARRALDDLPSHNVVVTTEGEIGLGLTNPTEKLQLRNGGMMFQRTAGNAHYGIGFNSEVPYESTGTREGARIYFDNDALSTWGDALVIEKTDGNQPNPDGAIIFSTRGTDPTRQINMIIEGRGDVGIGLSNPTEKLHVFGSGLIQEGGAGTSADQGFLKLVDDREQADIPNRGVQVMDNNEYAYFGMEHRATGHDAIVQWGDGTAQDLYFQHESGNTFTTVMHLDGATKNVGIGEIAPAARLDVGGNVRVQTLPAGSITGVVSDDQLVTANANGDLRKISASALFTDLQDDDWVIFGDRIYNANSNTVGIGTTNPDVNLALHIDGTTRLEGSSRLEFESTNNYMYRVNETDIRSVSHGLFRFRTRGDAADVMVVDGANGRLGIGTSTTTAGYIMEIEGRTKVREGSSIDFGNDPDNRISSTGNNELTAKANEIFVIRNRTDQDILTANRDREVGIRTTNPTSVLDIDGDLRIRTLPAGATGDDFLSVDVSGNVRKQPLATLEGPWDRTTAGGGRAFLRTVTDHVGIGTNAPAYPLHIVEATGTPRGANSGSLVIDHENSGGQSSIVFRSRVNRGSDYGYINYFDDNPDLGTGTAEQSLLEIGVQNDGANSNRDDIALMPSGELGIKTRTPTRVVDINGNLRVRNLANSATDIYAVTADANGNVNRQAITSIKDNLGNHIATEELQVGDNTISYDKNANEGIKFHSSNSVMVSGRFQIGNHREYWMDETITGITAEGFATNDAAIFVPVHTGTENSDLRLYITDNAGDAFSIWGSPCPTDCGDINASTQVVRIEGGGEVTMNSLAGTGIRMVVADANGVLNTQAIPTAGGGGTADNLGNHIATQELNLNWNWVRHNSGSNRAFRIRDDGTMEMAANRAIRFQSWNNRLAQTATGMELRSQNDLELQAISGDFIMQAGDRMDIRSNGTAAADEIRLMTRGGNERLVVQNDGDIEISDLTGTGNALVGVDANGVLERVSTSSDGLWDRDAGNNETYLFNNADEVGLGTTDPTAKLDVVGEGLFRNGNGFNGYGNDQLLFSWNNGIGYKHSIKTRHNSGSQIQNAIDFFLWDQTADAVNTVGTNQVMTLDGRNGGSVGLGTTAPTSRLHIAHPDGSGLISPSSIIVQNTTNQGSSGITFQESTGGANDNNSMSLRYHSSADGISNGFEIIRGAIGNIDANDVHFRVDRNSGQTTIQNLGTGGVNEMVVADVNGVLSTQMIAAGLWDRDAGNNYTTLANTTDRVGIGESAPSAILDIAGDLRIQSVAAGTIADELLVVNATGSVRKIPTSSFTNYFTRSVGGQIELITTTDQLGLGTAPAAGTRLHLGSGTLRVDDLAGLTTRMVTTTTNGTLTTADLGDYLSHWDRNSAAGDITLGTTTDQVGIGTLAPTHKLEVDGDVLITDLAGIGDRYVIANAAGELSTVDVPSELWTRDVTNQFTILSNSSDNVGIGTSTPMQKLHIATGTIRIDNYPTGLPTDDILVTDGSGDIKKVSSASYANLWTREPGNQEMYPVNINDRVGIGTTDPRTPLHLSIAGGSVGLADPVEFLIQNRTNRGTAQIRFRDNNSAAATAEAYSSMVLRFNGQSNTMEIANGSDSTHLRIRRQNGYMLLGANIPLGLNPSHQLHVDGNIGLFDGHRIQFAETNSFLRDQGTTAGGDDDVMLRASDILYLRGGDNQGIRVNGNGTLRFDDVPTAGSGLNLMTITGAGDVRRITAANYATNFGWRRTGTDVILATTGDNVGIGITSGGSKLDVNGTTRIRGATTIDNLGGGGTQMVVADNAGVLSVQAIPVDTDDQDLTWTSGTNTLSIEDGNSVNLSSLLDNTDAQDLSLSANTLSLTNDGTTVDLSGYLDNTDAQDLSLSGSTLSLTNDGTTVDLSAFANTDAQALGITGDDLTITGNASTVDLSGYLDNTDAQDLTLTGSTLSLTNDASTVDLSAFANTDAQDLSLSANTLSLTNDGTAVDLSGYLDNTDAQALSYDAATGIITLVSGGTVNLSASTIIDDQTLSLSGSELTIANGNMVDLAAISGWGKSGTDITLGTATDNVGIGTSPAAGVRLHVDGQVRFNALSGGGLELVMANANGDLLKRTAGEATGWTRTAGEMSLYNTGDNLMVGIGTATAKLHVNGNTQLDGTLTVAGTTTLEDDVTIGSALAGAQLKITSTGTDAPLRLENVQTAAAGPHDVLVLDASGDVQVVNGVTASDRRLKENIRPMEGTLEKLLGMESVSFNYRSDVKDYPYSLDKETHYGVIAQQVQEAFPHAVVEKDGYLHIQEKELMGVVISATKELSAKNAELEAANEHLAEQVYHMMMDKADLEKTVHSLKAETSELHTSMAKVLKHLESKAQVQASGN